MEEMPEHVLTYMKGLPVNLVVIAYASPVSNFYHPSPVRIRHAKLPVT